MKFLELALFSVVTIANENNREKCDKEKYTTYLFYVVRLILPKSPSCKKFSLLGDYYTCGGYIVSDM